MAGITVMYYLLSAAFVMLCLYNLVKEKPNTTEFMLYLILMAPFVLRLLRAS
jgi:hypothetical protein